MNIENFNDLTYFKLSEQQISTDLHDGIAILDMKASNYFSLEGVGKNIWQLIEQEKNFEEIYSAIVANYKVDVNKCKQDTNKFISELLAEGLVEVKT